MFAGGYAPSLAIALCLSTSATLALAQEQTLPSAASGADSAQPDVPRSSPKPLRPAATGFQGALRTGVSWPWRDATASGSDTMASRYAWQWPVLLEAGAKVSKAFFIGGYAGFGYGGEGSDPAIEAVCDDNDNNLENDIACSVVTLMIGLQAQYHLGPSEKYNPWFGYGVGFEMTQQFLNDRTINYRETHTSTGYSFAKLSVGLDYRGPIGLGPFADLTLGRFTSSSTDINGREVHSGPIDEQTWHGWLTVGARMVLFP